MTRRGVDVFTSARNGVWCGAVGLATGCDPSQTCVERACAPTQSGFANCASNADCLADAVCNTAVNDGECQSAHTMLQGQACGDTENCQLGLLCDVNELTCRVSGRDGDRCELNEHCDGPLICNGATQVCQPAASTLEGDDCFADEECVTGYRCAFRMNPYSGCEQNRAKTCQLESSLNGRCCGETCPEGYYCKGFNTGSSWGICYLDWPPK